MSTDLMIAIGALATTVVGAVNCYQAWFTPEAYIDRYERRFPKLPDGQLIGMGQRGLYWRPVGSGCHLVLSRIIYVVVLLTGIFVDILFLPKIFIELF